MATHANYLKPCFTIVLSLGILRACSASSREFTNDPAWFEDELRPVGASRSPVQAASTGTDIGHKIWCVAKPTADDLSLRRNIDFACGEGGVDCRYIQRGGPCFLPNTPIAHASYVMNMYYQKNGRNWWTCHFDNTGLVVFTDPSIGNCKYIAQW